MSARSIRRAQARRLAAERRRESLRRRRAGLVAGAAIGAATLAVSSAQAAPFQVTLTTDAAPDACDANCTLRDAITAANTSPGGDTITFASGLSGTIRLTQGALPISATSDGLTITGPGASVLTVSGDANNSGTPNAGDSRIFNITSASGSVSISGLTLTRGYDPAGGVGGALTESTSDPIVLVDDVVTSSRSDNAAGGGAIFASGPLTLTRTTISGNTAPAGTGGGIEFSASNDLTISASTISGNVGLSGGGIAASSGTVNIQDSQITGNQATGTPTSSGGGISSSGTVTIERSAVSGNSSTDRGGGMDLDGKYGVTVRDSVISGNTSVNGGGMSVTANSGKYSPVTIEQSTISGNHGSHGAGIRLASVERGDRVTINRSTISGNGGGASSFGGGLLIDGTVSGVVDLLDSTISGNTATAGGGVSLGSDTNISLLGQYNGVTTGSIDFDNSTIAGNTSTSHGGGVYLSQYDSGGPPVKKSGTASITSTIVAGNTAAGVPQDLDRVDTSTSGGFTGAFSLVQVPGDAPLTQLSTIVGIDPQLGALADNGGPTKTQLPAGTSPAIDKGRSSLTLKVDQRNQARTVETDVADAAAGGDGTDIGAVELDKSAVTPPPPAPTQAFSVAIRGAGLGGAGTPLIVAGSTPVDCTVSLGTISSCVIEIRAVGATKTRASKTVAKGALLASGAVTASSPVTKLTTKLTLTSDGAAVLKTRPIGLDATATAVASASGSPAATGTVHLLGGTSITLPTGARSTKLSSSLLKQLDQVAALLKGAKSITCTAYTDTGKGDVALTRSQAKAACARLVKSGVKGKITSTGKGHAKSVASNRTRKGRVANRRVVITFAF